MINLLTDQVVPNEHFGTDGNGDAIVLKVIAGGDYDDLEVVPCYRSDDPEKKSYCAHQAHYISTGIVL